MNLLKQGKKKYNIAYLLVLLVFYLFFILLNRENLFRKFDVELINKYLRSQDIEDRENKIKDRIFISDSDIYIASGYLYATSSEPSVYNFQHPPLIKYLFGLSAKYFNLPLLPNIFFGLILILEVFFLGKFVFKSEKIGILSSILIMFDPVFKEVTTYALLDLGQMVFILAFLISTFKFRSPIPDGVFLGLALASKFYSPVFIFLGLVYLYKLINKQFVLKHELFVLVFAFLVFNICYFSLFSLNFFYQQAKIIKFMLNHNQAIIKGGVVEMFFGGYVLWPVLFFVNLFVLFKSKFGSLKFLLTIMPIAYSIVLIFQIPFTRYFILILPFLYLSLTNFVVKVYNWCYKFKG